MLHQPVLQFLTSGVAKFRIKSLDVYPVEDVADNEGGIMLSTHVWRPTTETSVVLRGFATLYGGPAAAILPEHSHAEAQVTVRFAPRTAVHKRAPVHFDLLAPQQTHSGGWKEGWEVVVFHLSAQRLDEAAEELVPSGRFEIRPRNAQRDGLFEEMARTVLYEFRGRENMSRFYLDSIGHVLAGHILRRHCETQSHKEFSGLLSDEQLLALRRFIDEQIESGFSAPELAQAVGLGPQQFTQKLQMTTGLSPWRYVQAYRISIAQRMLRNPCVSIVEIANRLGFASQSHFTNVFRSKQGLTPNAYRKLQ
jgi:AraC-like DNA-binding protein